MFTRFYYELKNQGLPVSLMEWNALLEALEAGLRHDLREVLGINARVKLVEPHSIQRSEGKAKRVVDRRDVYTN